MSRLNYYLCPKTTSISFQHFQPLVSMLYLFLIQVWFHIHRLTEQENVSQFNLCYWYFLLLSEVPLLLDSYPLYASKKYSVLVCITFRCLGSPSQLAYTKYGWGGRLIPKSGHLAPLDTSEWAFIRGFCEYATPKFHVPVHIEFDIQRFW